MYLIDGFVEMEQQPFISLHIRSMWETTVMHKQVSGWTVNFGPNSPVYPLLRNTPPPHFGKLQIWDDQSLLWNTPPPHYGKLQIWNDQSLLRNTPPLWKTSDLGWPKFTPEYPPHYGKLQIWDDQSLLRNTPPIMENFRFGMTKVYSGIPLPIMENFRFGMSKVYSEIPFPPPIMENFRFGMTKVYSEIPPHYGKLQIWDDQSLLRNTPPPHYGKLQIWDDQSLLRNTPPNRKLSESSSLRFSEYRELLHVETLSNPDNY